MGIFSPTTFLSNLAQGGALQSLFQVTVVAPESMDHNTATYKYMTKAATIPESTITATPISYMGREIQVPGNRESTQWTNTVYNDEDFVIRHMLEDWTQNLNSGVGNTRAAKWTVPVVYTGTLEIMTYAKATASVVDEKTGASTETATKTGLYKFWGAWPSSVGEITLDWETNEIQEYEVTWEYAYWTRLPVKSS